MSIPLYTELNDLTKSFRKQLVEVFIRELTSRYVCTDQEDDESTPLVTYDDFVACDEMQIDCHTGDGAYAGTLLFIPSNGTPIAIEMVSDYGGTKAFMNWLDEITQQLDIEVSTPNAKLETLS